MDGMLHDVNLYPSAQLGLLLLKSTNFNPNMDR